MKFTIDIEDFWLDDESELEPKLKQYIIGEVVRSIHKSIDAKVEEHITRSVKLMVEQRLTYKINQTIEDMIKTEKIKVDGHEVEIVDFIKKKFQNDSGWSSPHETIKKLAQVFGAEMKQRYDLAFASQIVAKLNENQMLKDDVAKLLLNDSKKS